MKKAVFLASLAVMVSNVLGMEHKNLENCSITKESVQFAPVQNDDSNASMQNQVTDDTDNQLFNRVIWSVIQDNQTCIRNTCQLIGSCIPDRYLSESILSFFSESVNTLDAAVTLCTVNSEIQTLYQILLYQNDIIQTGVPKFVSELIKQINKLDSYSDLAEAEKENAESKIIFLNQILWSAFQNNQFLIIKDFTLLNWFLDRVEYSNDPDLEMLTRRVDIMNNSMSECEESINFSEEGDRNDQFSSFFKEERQHIANVQKATIKTRDEYISNLLNQISQMSLQDQLYFTQKIFQQSELEQITSEPVRVQDGRDQASTSTAVYNEVTGKYEEPGRKFNKSDNKNKGKRSADDSEDEDDDRQAKKRKIDVQN